MLEEAPRFNNNRRRHFIYMVSSFKPPHITTVRERARERKDICLSSEVLLKIAQGLLRVDEASVFVHLLLSRRKSVEK